MAYSNGVYSSPAWVNGQAPAINQSNLSDLNKAIYSSEECLGDMFLTLNDYSSDSNYRLCNGTMFGASAAGDLPEILPVTYGHGAFGTYPNGTLDMVVTGYSHNYDDYFFRATSEGTTSVIQYREIPNGSGADTTDWTTITGGTSTYHNGTRTWVAIDANEDGYFWAVSADGYVVYGDKNGVYDAAYLNDALLDVSLPRKGKFASSGGTEYSMPIVASPTKIYKFTSFSQANVVNQTGTYPFTHIRLLSNGFIYASKSLNGGTTVIYCSVDGGATMEEAMNVGTGDGRFDVNDNGELVALFSDTYNILYRANFFSRYSQMLAFTTPLTDCGGITINNSGILFVDGYTTSAHSSHCYTFYDFRAKETLLQAAVSASSDPFYTNPKLFEDNTTIAKVKSNSSLIYTSDDDLIETTDGDILVSYTDSGSSSIGSSLYFGKSYSVNSYGSGKYVMLPNATSADIGANKAITIGTVKASDIGNMYIRRNKLYKNGYTNWQNNATKLSADNLTRLGNLVGSRELQVGDFVFSYRDDLATAENGLLKCNGQTISADTYPLLAPKVYAYYGNYKLPAQLKGTMYQIWMYVKAY